MAIWRNSSILPRSPRLYHQQGCLLLCVWCSAIADVKAKRKMKKGCGDSVCWRRHFPQLPDSGTGFIRVGNINLQRGQDFDCCCCCFFFFFDFLIMCLCLGLGVNTGCLHQLLSTLFFETGSQLGVYRLIKLAGQPAPGPFCLPSL